MTTITETAPAAPTPGAPVKGRKVKSGSIGLYLLVRFLLIFPTIFILVTMVFIVSRSTGDPITASLGGKLPPDQLAALIHEAGYDRPIIVQYFDYLGQIFTGNFGVTQANQPVTEVLLRYGGATLELAFYALIVAFIVGIPLGMLAGYLRDRWPDAVLRVLAILAYATPIFFAGLLLKLVFSVWLGVLPSSGRASVRYELLLTNLPDPTGIYLIDAIRLGSPKILGDVLAHAALPGIALGLLTAGIFLRLVRTNVIGTLSMDYVDAARSRGVSEFRLVRLHAFRPALVPIITVIGLQIAVLLGGAVLTETTFEWKGLGFELSHFLKARDFVAVQGIVALLAVIVAVTNFVVDIIATLIDPRVRF
jgi:peptide/nickel transport system permease protein